MKTFTLFCLLCAPLLAQDIVVTVDVKQPVLISRFSIGTTHTHGFWEYGAGQAVSRAENLLIEGVKFQNQHIMGWGAGNPEPQPGVYQWSELDHRVELMGSIGAPMFITFCQAPGWMKGTGDWEMEQEVLDEYVGDFAELCAAVADRYKEVQYFQVWNELKGYWSSTLNNWDYKRYTTLYNAVYTAVKAVRPDALVGGPYIVIQGDGASQIGKSGNDTYVPLGDRDKTVLTYWLKNKVGADFICMDYSLIDYHDANSYTHDEQMRLTKFWGEWIRDIRAMTDLPMVISEFYGGSDAENQEFTAANHASCYVQALINGAAIALQWNPEEGELTNFLFTDTAAADGGQPKPHYDVIKAINDHFSAGTEIVASTSSSEWLEVLASAEKALLINKKDQQVSVMVNGRRVELGRYQVKVIDTPAASSVDQHDEKQESSTIELDYSPGGASIHLVPARSTVLTVQIYNVLGQRVYEFSQPVTAREEAVIRVFDGSPLSARGVYFVHVLGLEQPLVQQVTLK